MPKYELEYTKVWFTLQCNAIKEHIFIEGRVGAPCPVCGEGTALQPRDAGFRPKDKKYEVEVDVESRPKWG